MDFDITEEAISTGFKRLDGILGGGFRRGLCIINGAPSVGKTALISQMADSISESGSAVATILSLSTRKEDLSARSLSRTTKQIEDRSGEKVAASINMVMNGCYARSIQEAASLKGENATTILDLADFRSQKVLDAILKKRKKGRNIVFIDSMHGLLFSAAHGSILHAVTRMRELSREYSATIVVTSSFRKIPPDVEQASDIVINMKEETGRLVYTSAPVELSVLKNNYGSNGILRLNFLRKFALFKEIPEVTLEKVLTHKSL